MLVKPESFRKKARKVISKTVMQLCVETVTLDNSHEYIVPGFVLQRLLRAAVASVSVDEEWYLKKYPDVANAIASGLCRSARDHYCLYGYYENRQPYSISIDSSFYLQNNPDVAEAVDKKFFKSPQAHFDAIGFSEGRLPRPNFSLFREEL